MTLPIIITHYGFSRYLELTLGCARFSNPGRECILIGDDENSIVAENNGWTHVNRWDLKSIKKQEFNDVFRWIQGSRHIAVKGNRDWFRWQWERWFLLEVYARQRGIASFWHFDSDVMVVRDLHVVESKIELDENSVMTFLNLNGFCSTRVLGAMCDYVIRLFNDRTMIRKIEQEIAKGSPYFAFTEMSALEMFFRENNEYSLYNPYKKLEDIGLCCDAAILNEDGMQMSGSLVFPVSLFKDISVVDGNFFCYKSDSKACLDMVSINCSWVPLCVNNWIYSALRGRHSGHISESFRLRNLDMVLSLVRNCYMPVKKHFFSRWLILGLRSFLGGRRRCISRYKI